MSSSLDADAPDRRTWWAARRIRSFAARHAQNGSAAVQGVVLHIGQRQMRVVLRAADGTYGDLIVRGRPAAEHALRLAGATSVEATDREFGAGIQTGPYEWRRMAGPPREPGRS